MIKMGIYDRDYSRGDYQSGGPRPQMQFRFPQITPVVKWLLIVNVSVFFACIIVKPLGGFIYEWFSVDARKPLQLWRLVGYQFLHNPAGIGHIAMNMLGLYFLGPTLERYWGSNRFLKFYLYCGVAGGMLYLLLVWMGLLGVGVLVGASGAILGMLAACAILFPQFVVFIFLFPVPIRIAALILTLFYVFSIFVNTSNAGGNAAHFGGMAAGALYVFLGPKWKQKSSRARPSMDSWEKKMQSYRRLQQEVDRILDKVNRHGISSLTRKEKKTLEEATKLEQMKNRT